MALLYNYDIISVDDLIYIWTTSFKKHELIVTLLYSFWNEMVSSVQLKDMIKFLKVAVNDVGEQNEEYIIFYFELISSFVNNTGFFLKNLQTNQISYPLTAISCLILTDCSLAKTSMSSGELSAARMSSKE